jgi:hypothetical protein
MKVLAGILIVTIFIVGMYGIIDFIKQIIKLK